MGKIRIKTIGDEQVEKQQQNDARKRAETKHAEKEDQKPPTTETQEKHEIKHFSASDNLSDSKVAKTFDAKPKSKYALKSMQRKRSQKYQTVVSKIDKNKIYSLHEALALLPQLKLSNFDESVELHINTVEQGISGNALLPYGTGKKMRIKIVNQSEDPGSLEECIKKVEAGIIDFDVLLATPDSMPRLARIARHLGPRGLMPNPKNGTITPKPEEAAKKYASGQVNFKSEAKFPIIHLTVGKLSFLEKKLSENIKTAIEAVQIKNIKNITLKSTMSPGMKISTNTLP